MNSGSTINTRTQDSFTKASLIMILSIILGTVTYAWVGPTSMAPNGNVPPPINVGSVLQEKLGGLKIFGDLTVGTTTSPNATLTVHGKIYSESTLSSDTAHTVVTKDFIPRCSSGKFLTSDGNQLLCKTATVPPSCGTESNVGPNTVVTFTSSCVFVVPDGVNSVNLKVVGGGGGGGGGSDFGGASSGGQSGTQSSFSTVVALPGGGGGGAGMLQYNYVCYGGAAGAGYPSGTEGVTCGYGSVTGASNGSGYGSGGDGKTSAIDGGGGGGSGGAGQVVTQTLSVTSGQNISVVVGGGGSRGSSTYGNVGTSGTNGVVTATYTTP